MVEEIETGIETHIGLVAGENDGCAEDVGNRILRGPVLPGGTLSGRTVGPALGLGGENSTYVLLVYCVWIRGNRTGTHVGTATVAAENGACDATAGLGDDRSEFDFGHGNYLQNYETSTE